MALQPPSTTANRERIRAVPTSIFGFSFCLVWLSWLSEASSPANVLSCKGGQESKDVKVFIFRVGVDPTYLWILKGKKSPSVWSTWQEKKNETNDHPKLPLPGIRPLMPSIKATEMCQAFPLNYTNNPAAWPSLEKKAWITGRERCRKKFFFSPNTVLDQT